MLMKHGNAEHISVFENGSTAIEELKARLENGTALPDIILLDINMPVMDGWEFMSTYDMLQHELLEHVSIYMISSSIFEEDIARAKAHKNIDSYMQKPLNAFKIQKIFGL